MWTRDGTVLTVSSRALVTACERLGVDTTVLLESTGIDRRILDDPDARLKAGQASALWSKAYELSGDPMLSLHAAQACPVGAYKVIDFMGHSARTVGEAFAFAARYFKLVNTAVSLPIDDSGDPVLFAMLASRSSLVMPPIGPRILKGCNLFWVRGPVRARLSCVRNPQAVFESMGQRAGGAASTLADHTSSARGAPIKGRRRSLTTPQPRSTLDAWRT